MPHTAAVTQTAPTGSVLRDREYRALLVADGLSGVGDQVTRIAVALLVLERSGSAFAATATYAASYLTWVLGGPVLSSLADRWPRRTVMAGADAARLLLVLCLALPGLPLAGVFGLLLALGLLAPPYDAARGALLADVLDGEAYVRGSALSLNVSQAAQVAGFLAGGGLVAALGVQAALLLDAATFALSVVLLLTAVRHRPGSRDGTPVTGALTELAAGARLVGGDARLRGLLGWALLSAAVVIAPEGLAVAVAQQAGAGAVWAGVLTASVPAGFLLGSAVLVRLEAEQREALFSRLVLLSALPLLASAVAAPLPVLAALWFVAGAGNALQVVANTSFVAAVPAHLRGRAFGVAGTVLMVGQGAVLLVAGALADALGPRAAVGCLAGAAVLVLLALRRRVAGATAARSAGTPTGTERTRRTGAGSSSAEDA